VSVDYQSDEHPNYTDVAQYHAHGTLLKSDVTVEFIAVLLKYEMKAFLMDRSQCFFTSHTSYFETTTRTQRYRAAKVKYRLHGILPNGSNSSVAGLEKTSVFPTLLQPTDMPFNNLGSP
jgi:hypothetical protein